MSAQATQDKETVLVVGATGNIGISAIQGALYSGRNVLAVVRNQDSAKKLSEHVGQGQERMTVVEADVVSDTGVQGVVDKVRAGALPAFQHVYASVGGGYTEVPLLETSTKELQQYMAVNLWANFFAYRATVPYLLAQKGQHCTWTTCTGSQGDKGDRALPAISQGGMFSMATAACRELAGTHVRFNEVYLAQRVEVDAVAEQHGTMKSSIFAHVYKKILGRADIKGCRIRVDSKEDVENLKYEQK